MSSIPVERIAEIALRHIEDAKADVSPAKYNTEASARLMSHLTVASELLSLIVATKPVVDVAPLVPPAPTSIQPPLRVRGLDD